MYFAERTYPGRHHNWQKQSAHKAFSFQTLVGSVSLQVLLLSGGSLAGIKKPEGKPIGYPANSIQDHQTESCSRSGAPARSFFQEYGNSIGYCWCNSSEKILLTGRLMQMLCLKKGDSSANLSRSQLVQPKARLQKSSRNLADKMQYVSRSS